MGQRRMHIEKVQEIVGRVHYSKAFRVGRYGDGYFVQIEYWEDDVLSGEASLQRGRKWIVSAYATESEVVQTCLTAALASAEHQVREHFTYAGPCPRCGGAKRLLNDFAEYPEGEPPECPDCEGTGRGRPRAIYGPHFHADVLYGICGKRANYDARDDPE